MRRRSWPRLSVAGWRLARALTGLALSAAIAALAALAVVSYIKADDQTRRALDARDSTAARATRRIDLLQESLEDAKQQSAANGKLLAEALAGIDALRAQLQQAGVTPVISAPTSAQRAAATPTTTAAPRPSTSSTTRPPSSPPPATTTTTTPNHPPTTPPSPPPSAPCTTVTPLLTMCRQ